MASYHIINKELLTNNDIVEILKFDKKLKLSNESKSAISKCRKYLENKLTKNNTLYYGINTGFGSLCNVQINNDEIETLQENLVRSHACGMGEEIPKELIRIILLLKIQSLSFGYSGVRLELVERLILFYNNDVLPVIYTQGSLGASGDLSPLAHLSITLIGEGEVFYKGKKTKASTIHKKLGWTPLRLKTKEGLALLNGTQFSLAYALWCNIHAERLSKLSDIIAAISLDAFDCKMEPFDLKIHVNRPHDWQIKTAYNIQKILAGSEIGQQYKINVQDPYAFRCIPQVHGASKSTIEYVKKTVEVEMNAVTDNPNIFPDADAIISGGNFHAQPLALASDFLAIALSELGSISERRLYQIISGQRNLPVFLTDGAGLHSGFMITQYTAASIVSQNKQLCTPASIDSIVSCNGQEDHVSMAANAGTKCYKVVKNIYSLLAIELLASTQALEYRRPLKSSLIVEKFIANFRKEVSRLKDDRLMYKDMHAAVEYLKNVEISKILPKDF